MSGLYTLHDVGGAVLATVDCPVRAHELLRDLEDAVVWRLPNGTVGGTKLRVSSGRPFRLRERGR